MVCDNMAAPPANEPVVVRVSPRLRRVVGSFLDADFLYTEECERHDMMNECLVS